MTLVVIETPYAGDVARNLAYARVCMLDSLRRGESPFVSHLLYTQVLDDNIPSERTRGISVGLLWGQKADATIVYTDFGTSKGMELGVRAAVNANRIVVERKLMHGYYLTKEDLEKPWVRDIFAILKAP